MAEMHKNMTVTRTASTGNCTGTSTGSETESAGFPFARRHSSAGIRAFMWATASACSFGSSLGSESRGSKDSIRSIVVTPDSIPQFTIPKLALEDSYRSRSNEKEQQSEEDEEWDISEPYPPQAMSASLSSSLSSTSSFGFSPGPGRKLPGGISDHASIKRVPNQGDPSFSCPLMEAEHCSDPASRAALSLHHLPKVTTPYGFITLSKSPQMASEETLLQTGHRRSPEEISSRHPKLEMKRSVPVRTSPVQVWASTPPHRSPAFRQRFIRSHSVTEIEIQRQLAQKKQSRSTPASQAPATKSKQSLWGVLRKHLKNQKESLSISI